MSVTLHKNVANFFSGGRSRTAPTMQMLFSCAISAVEVEGGRRKRGPVWGAEAGNRKKQWGDAAER